MAEEKQYIELGLQFVGEDSIKSPQAVSNPNRYIPRDGWPTESEGMIRVNFGGDILDVPVTVFDQPRLLSWFLQPRHSGDSPKLHTMCRLAWQRYKAVSGQPFLPGLPTTTGAKPLKRNRYQLWLRHKLTAWGII